ncbi:hypothetical protein pb186bvf_002809 [Paramecium bursaria]
MEKLQRLKHELKEDYKERCRVYNIIYKQEPSRAVVLSNIYMNQKQGNKYPNELENELKRYLEQSHCQI